jgi:hypothetical protein
VCCAWGIGHFLVVDRRHSLSGGFEIDVIFSPSRSAPSVVATNPLERADRHTRFLGGSQVAREEREGDTIPSVFSLAIERMLD